METVIISIVAVAIGLIVGITITSTFLRKAIEKKSENILKDAEEKGEMIKKDKILQAKEKFLQMKSDYENAYQEKNKEILKNENRLKQKEATISQKFEEIQRKQKEVTTIKDGLTAQLEIFNKKQLDLDKAIKQQVDQLEAISGMSAQEARTQLIETLKDDAKADALVHIKDIVEEAKLTANTEARKIVIETIQRTAAEHAIENSVSVLKVKKSKVVSLVVKAETSEHSNH